MKKYISIVVAVLVLVASFGAGIPVSAAAKSSVLAVKTSDLSALYEFDPTPEHLFDDVYRINTKNEAKTLSKLVNSSAVTYAEPDVSFQIALSANDPLFVLDSKDIGKQWYMPKIEAHKAWERTTGSNLTTVAVVDTGIDGLHEDLGAGRVVGGYANFCQVADPADSSQCLIHLSGELSPGVNSDDNGHGTLVAGLIGAVPNNSKGIAGVNWQVRLMPIKVLDRSGSGQATDVAVGIRWAADHGADVINLSIGGPGLEQLSVLQESISYAFSKGVLVVAASGNDAVETGGDLNLNPTSPVCMDGGENMVIGVSAVDINDRKAKFSNFGSNCVDISAPGTGSFVDKNTKQGLVTTYYDPTRPGEHDLYVYAVGTSVATPLVSGTAALMIGLFPNLDVRAIRDQLISSSDDITNQNRGACGGRDCGRDIGKGRLNVFRAVSVSQAFSSGTVLQNSLGTKYLIERGLKLPISDFVFNQRFKGTSVTLTNQSQLDTFPTGDPVPPVDGSLIKVANHPAVYLVEGGERKVMSLLAFVSRRFNFDQVTVLSDSELNSYPLGGDATVLDGALVKTADSPAVYVLSGDSRQLLSFFVYKQRGFDLLPIAEISQIELNFYPPNSESFLHPPLEGTLIRGDKDSTVYLVVEGSLRGLNLAAFNNRGFRFENVNVLPQGEVSLYQQLDVILE